MNLTGVVLMQSQESDELLTEVRAASATVKPGLAKLWAYLGYVDLGFKSDYSKWSLESNCVTSQLQSPPVVSHHSQSETKINLSRGPTAPPRVLCRLPGGPAGPAHTSSPRPQASAHRLPLPLSHLTKLCFSHISFELPQENFKCTPD